MKRFGLVCSCILIVACSKLDVITGPFFVTFDADSSVMANLVVVPQPENFAAKGPITGGQKLQMNLFFTVPEIFVHGAAPNADKIWNVYKVIPGGFTYSIRRAESHPYTIVNSLDAAKFGTGETVYLHESHGLWGDFKDTHDKTALAIAKSSSLTYSLPHGKTDGTSADPVTTPQDAKLYAAAPAFYFSKDAEGKEKITKLANNTPISVQVAKAGGTVTITLAH